MRYALVFVDSSLLDSGVPVTSLITGLLPWFDSCQKEKDPRYGERGRELNGTHYSKRLGWPYLMKNNRTVRCGTGLYIAWRYFDSTPCAARIPTVIARIGNCLRNGNEPEIQTSGLRLTILAGHTQLRSQIFGSECNLA